MLDQWAFRHDQDGNLVDPGEKHYVSSITTGSMLDEDGKILKGEQVIDAGKSTYPPGITDIKLKGILILDGHFDD